MEKEIMTWLEGPREYHAGVALYDKYGYNKVLKNNLLKGETENLRAVLEYELGKLVGLDESQLKTMVRRANGEKQESKEIPFIPAKPRTYVDDLLLQLADQFHVSVGTIFTCTDELNTTDEQKAAIEKLAPVYAAIPETMKKTIRIREQYPFLKDESCPQELKIMVHDMFTAYDVYREAYAELDPTAEKQDNLNNAAIVVENFLANRAMWGELDYYKENNEVLGEHPVFEALKLKEEIHALTDIELMQKQNNVKSNLTKSRKAIEKATSEKDDAALEEANNRLEKWEKLKTAVDAELVSRGK